MSPLLRLIVLTAAAGVLFAGSAALATALAYPRIRHVLARISPPRRSAWLLAVTGAPWLVAGALVTACFLPSLAALAGVGLDHCPAHDTHHAHLCFSHLPGQPLGAFELLLVTAAVAMIAAMGLRLGVAQARAWRAARALLRIQFGHEVHGAIPLAVTIGFWHPEVVVTSELRSRLTREELDVVVEHELAHARRRDPLRLTFAAALALGHLPHVRQAVLTDLALACEQACDEEAAQRVPGGRLRVAETVVAVEKLAGRAAWAPVAFGGASVTARVESLLGDPDTGRAPRSRLWIASAIALLALAALAPAIHHATETFLGFLAG